MGKRGTNAVFAGGVVAMAVGLSADYIGMGSPGSGLGGAQWLIIGTGALLMLAARVLRRASFRLARIGFANTALALASATAAVVVFECAYTAKVRWLDRRPPGSVAIFDPGASEIVFDPITGYRLPPRPVRYARITHGTLEFSVSFRGNAQGFPDRDDFNVSRRAPDMKRYLVLGDSFSSMYVDTPWPDRTEDMLAASGKRVELLNASLAAYGLGNWWSLVSRYFGREPFELDGVIFAVFRGDIDRKFFVRDCGEAGRCRAAFWPSWDPATYPSSLSEAARHFSDEPYVLMDGPGFDAVVAGDFLELFPLRPLITARLIGLFHSAVRPRPASPATEEPALTESQRRLVDGMARVFRERDWPVHVFYLRDRADLMRPARPVPRPISELSEALGARLIDTHPLLAPDPIGNFYPHDGHWNQIGSDRFARFVARFLGGDPDPLSGG